MGHSVSKAADNAVKKGEKTKTADRTPEQIIADIRRNLASNLAVTPDDQRFLLVQYDQEYAAVLHLGAAVAGLSKRAEAAEALVVELRAKNEEFRSVYEAENSSQTLKVETLASGEAGTAGAKGTTGASGMAGAVPTE